MTTTLEKETLNSFFNLDKNAEQQWMKYVQFISKLYQGYESDERKQIQMFWNQEIVETQEDTLPWVDIEALENAQKLILSHPEKRNSKCFNKLILNKKALYPKDFSIFDELDKELPNFKEVTEFYRGSFALNQSRSMSEYQAPRPVLLLGNPGIGKTHYAKKLAKLLGTHYRFFDSNSISSGWVLSGNNASWKGADAGLIFRELAKSETVSPIFLLDEIDKIKSTREHSPFSTFHQLFEKENAKTFADEFIDIEFNASQIIYILTANDAKNIEDSLLSRMNVFHIDNPDAKAMEGIIQDIYKSTLGGSRLFAPTLAQSEIDKLTTHTPREVSKIISKYIFKQASQNSSNKNEGVELVIDVNEKEERTPIGF